jgi:phosphatidylserine decarboxylase
MRIAPGGLSLAGWVLAVGATLAAAGWFVAGQGLAIGLGCVGLFLSLFVLFFFRDPERNVASSDRVILSGADGVVRLIEPIAHDAILGVPVVRISIFLSALNVHVNRSPMAGVVKHLAYVPGRKLFAFLDAASEVNEHSTIVIEGARITCLVRQIVGPVARRVVYWLELNQRVGQGERIGIMKFGSRMDIHLPADRVAVQVRRGDVVRAGETVVALIKDV